MNAIVAVDKRWAIGCEGKLLFSLPTDMKRFRSLTTGGTVVLGRKTLDSFPGGKPLPNRQNIVISRNPDFFREGCVIVPSPAAALTAAALTAASGEEDDRIWIIGGGSVYACLLSQCKRVYLTMVDTTAEAADTFFPNLDKLPGWEVENTSEPIEENGLTYRFIDYVNTKL